MTPRPSSRGGARRAWIVTASALVALAAAGLAQEDREDPKAPPRSGPVRRELYAGTPGEIAPYRGLEPHRWLFVEKPEFRGPGREEADPEGLASAVIGLVTPRSGPDGPVGRWIEAAVRLAIDDANAEGGYGDAKLPFALAVRDEGAQWGQAGDAMVDLVEQDGAWAVMGAYEDANSHVMTRVVLKAQVPNVNTCGPDPTLTEHNVPWVLRNRPDDRQAAYRLVRKIYAEDGRKRVVLFRANDRYGRTGVKEFTDAARRLGHPVALETRYLADESDFAARIERIKASKPDAIVFWGRPAPTAAALRAVRAAGIGVPCYGPDRLADPRFLAAAGAAAEGFVFTFPFDPSRCGERWERFRKAFVDRTGEEPYADAAYAYDGARMIVAAMRRAGLNRPRILDALFEKPEVDGVTGKAPFDLVTGNNMGRMVLGRVEGGRFVIGE